jgi:hypothetical protein
VTKRCGRCRIEKPVSDFHRRGRTYQTWCKVCRRAYDSVYHRSTRTLRVEQKKERHAEFVEWYLALKDGKPCADCGDMYHPSAMQWDHVPGAEKLASVSDLCRKNNRRRVLEEIAKCELVCSNRHAVRTFQRQRGVAQPG